MASRRQHNHATILPVPANEPRPLWSVMIPTYNCSDHYLRETLTSVLAQDPGPEIMQIEVVDDHSPEGAPAAIVEEVGRGRVTLYRQPINLGHTRNYSSCLQRARGQFVHVLHQDDRVRDGFYDAMQQVFDEYPAVGAAFCRVIFMDEQGHWQALTPLLQKENGVLHDALERIVTQQPLQPPAMVVRREVYERLGGFDPRLASSAEDTEMWIRIASHYPIGYSVEPLALYRRFHKASLTSRVIRDGSNIRDCRQANAIYRAYLPTAVADDLARRGKEPIVAWALLLAYDLLQEGDFHTALVQIREALKTERSLQVVGRIVRLFLGVGIRSTYRALHTSSLLLPRNNAR